MPFSPELRLEGYLTSLGNFVGRQWLVKKIKSKLMQSDIKQKGILATADMGYGKSAFVTHLLCGKHSEPIGDIKSKIVAYHVCKFDVLSTKKPALFIRRVIGMISNRVPELGNILSMMPNTSMIFDKDLCEQDPVGCFDQGFLFPVRNIQNHPTETFLIVIDGLDECSETFDGQNRISDLIRRRAHDLPSWMFLLITSRNTTNVRLSKDILHMHLSTKDHKNLRDMKKYIKKKLAGTGVSSKLKNNFRINSSTTLIEKVMNKSGGNFQFLTHALEYWYTLNGTVKENDVPDSLDRIYELNFERVFGTDQTNFQNAKLVLEVMCASFHRLSVKKLMDILKMNPTLQSQSNANIKRTLEQLVNFVKRENDTLMFAHQSIRDWLLSKENTNFVISVENGAAALSEYMLNEMNAEARTFNFSQLVLQVISANNKNIEDKFLYFTQNKTKTILEMNTLHDIVTLVDSPKAIDLIARHYKNIDEPNENNMTATGVAVCSGHLKSLERLLQYGADLNVTVGTYIPEHSFFQSAEVHIEYFKIKHFPGYKLLHLAAQFGQISVVDFILSKQRSQMHTENYLGHLPFHLACEFGRKEVVEYFIFKENVTDDFLCLYLASKNQHESVVKLLLSLNSLNYRCLTEKDANETAKVIRYIREKGGMIVTSDHVVRTLDVWWKLRQDSPLLASIRNGNFIISKMIVRTLPFFLDCTDAGGMTPFLTSISYQRIDVFKLLVNDRISDICTGQTIIMQRLGDTLMGNDKLACEKGMGLAHLLAYSGTQEMIEHIQKVEKLNFKATALGVSPMHLAACAGNIHFLTNANLLGANLDVTSNNGSSLYHSAISCRSYIGLVSMGNLPYKRDNLGMSLGLYLVKDPKITPHNHVLEKLKNVIELLILEHLINSKLNFITERDYRKRNFFHYALRNGYYHLIKYLLNSKPNLSLLLLQQRDEQGNTPITYAINSLKPSRNESDGVYKFPEKCHYTDVFRDTECLDATDLTQLVPPVELSILYVMMHVENPTIKSAISGELRNIILGSKMYLIAYLFSNKTRNMDLRQEVLYAINRGPEPYNMLTLALLSPETLLNCDTRNTDPPLHALLKHMDALLLALGENKVPFLNMFKSKAAEDFLLTCIDKNGMSLIERAVNDGALLFLKLLIDICQERSVNLNADFDKILNNLILLKMNTKSHDLEIERRQKIRQLIVTKSNLQVRNANITLAKNETQEGKVLRRINYFNNISSRNFKTEYVILRKAMPNNEPITKFDAEIFKLLKNDDQYLNFEPMFWIRKDELFETILLSFGGRVDLSKLCARKITLSLIHLMAAANMHKGISVLVEKAPFNVLNCTNKHGVTPLYLAKVFRAEATVKILERKFQLILPEKTFEEAFLFKLLSNFVDSNPDHPLFYIPAYNHSVSLLRPHKFHSYLKSLQIAQDKSFRYNNIYLLHFPDLPTKFFKNLFSALSVTRTIISASTKNETLKCFYFRRFLGFYQFVIYSMFESGSACNCTRNWFLNQFSVYSEIWENPMLFKNFQKCYVLRKKLNVISKVRMFTARLIIVLLKAKHNIVYNMIMQEVKASICSTTLTLFREKTFFCNKEEETSVYKPQTPRKEHLVKYKYLDLLKGLYIKSFKGVAF